LDLLPDFDASKLNEATLQLATTQIFLALRHIASGGFNEKLGGDPEIFARLVHAMARASRETLNLQKYREACAKTKAAELKQLDPDRDLSDKDFELLVKKADRVFKVARPSSSSSAPAAPKN